MKYHARENVNSVRVMERRAVFGCTSKEKGTVVGGTGAVNKEYTYVII